MDDRIKLELTKACIYEMSLLFNQRIQPEKITAYATALVNYPTENLKIAFRNIILSGEDFFPSCARLIKEMQPPRQDPEELAQIMCDNIVEAVLRYGRYRQDEIKEKLTAEEMDALTRIGGALTILDSKKSDMPTIRSQIRKSCKALVNKELIASKAEIFKKLQNRGGELQKLSDNLNVN